MITPRTDHLIDLALEEDVAHGDLTSRAAFTDDHRSRAIIEAGHELIVSGAEVAARVFAKVDARMKVTSVAKEGTRLKRGGIALRVSGPTASILTAERTALNFLQRLSGIATLSRRFADAVMGTEVRVVDTRKTTPGFRALEKAAVAAGGCGNHRFDLGSGVLIKDNHIVACGGVKAAVTAAKARAPHPLRIEVEVTNLDELAEALDAGAEIVLLDNMTPAQVEVAAARAHGRGVLVEVSGGITLATIADYARAGADLISVGALTHSAPAVDIGLDVRA